MGYCTQKKNHAGKRFRHGSFFAAISPLLLCIGSL
jgi:hypothetical protein